MTTDTERNTHKKTRLTHSTEKDSETKKKSETHIDDSLETIHYPCYWKHQNENEYMLLLRKPNTKDIKVTTVLYFPNHYQKVN